jgi:hypothetical protein
MQIHKGRTTIEIKAAAVGHACKPFFVGFDRAAQRGQEHQQILKNFRDALSVQRRALEAWLDQSRLRVTGTRLQATLALQAKTP